MGARPTPPVSVVAGLMALASAFVGSVVYAAAFPGDPSGFAPWGYALGWGMPLAIVAFAYLGRRLDTRLAAGIFLGAGMAQFFGWLPNLFGPGTDFGGAWTWVSITSGMLAIAGGLVAATAHVEPRKPPVGVGASAEPPPPPPPPGFPWTPPDGPTKPCSTCGYPLDPRSEICPACGSRQAPAIPETPD